MIPHLLSSPSPNCPLCPRLARFRQDNQATYPLFFNAPVPSFGPDSAELLVVGLAPGLKGANQTGRPFTGDYAGLVLYSALKRFSFAAGDFAPERCRDGEGDGFRLVNCRVTNAVRCVPPENKPEPGEIKTCNSFLTREIAGLPKLKLILSLGLVSHKAVLMARGFKQSARVFKHGAEHELDGVGLIDSYHCSRYNINTGVLTQAMFDRVVERARMLLGG